VQLARSQLLYAAQLAWREYEFCEFSLKHFALIKAARSIRFAGIHSLTFPEHGGKICFIVEITVVENYVNINDTF
jgi:hypothetical protein